MWDMTTRRRTGAGEGKGLGAKTLSCDSLADRDGVWNMSVGMSNDAGESAACANEKCVSWARD